MLRRPDRDCLASRGRTSTSSDGYPDGLTSGVSCGRPECASRGGPNGRFVVLGFASEIQCRQRMGCDGSELIASRPLQSKDRSVCLAWQFSSAVGADRTCPVLAPSLRRSRGQLGKPPKRSNPARSSAARRVLYMRSTPRRRRPHQKPPRRHTSAPAQDPVTTMAKP
jgi:hypothetical protein